MQRERTRSAGERARCRAALVVAAAISVCVGCSAGLEDFKPSAGEQPALPPAELDGVIFEGYRGERRDLSVTAEKATVDMVARVADLERVKFTFSEGSSGPIDVSAPTGELNLDQDDFVLSGGVTGSATEGESFSTDTVRYSAAKRELMSSSPVDLQRENLVLRADGMTLGLDARRLRLIGNVHARVAPR